MGRRILQRCVSLLRHPCLGVKQGPHRTSPPPTPGGSSSPRAGLGGAQGGLTSPRSSGGALHPASRLSAVTPARASPPRTPRVASSVSQTMISWSKYSSSRASGRRGREELARRGASRRSG